ncbi:MAG: hypothetical protein ACLGH7_10480 [Actinomycetes bacterium]
MKTSRIVPFAAACAAALALSTIPTGPVAAEVTGVTPGTMRCSYAFIEVNAPQITTQSANSYSDHYIPKLMKWTASTGWVERSIGERYLWDRFHHEWTGGTRTAKFQIPIEELAKDTYWAVIQTVEDKEAGLIWSVSAYLANHDPEFCNATGPWD